MHNGLTITSIDLKTIQCDTFGFLPQTITSVDCYKHHMLSSRTLLSSTALIF